MATPEAHQGIVVGVDGSTSSTEAVRWAALEAGMRKLPLVIVHVRSTMPVGAMAMGFAVAPIPQEAFDWQLQHAETAVRGAVDTVHAAEPRVRVSGEVICGSAVQR